MEFNFSDNNQITEFETLDTSSNVYLGFSNPPVKNIFSQKYFKSPYGSTTETLINNLDLLEVSKEKNYKAIIHLVQGWVTLDGATAAYALKQDRKVLKSKYWTNLANYISEHEKGATTPPFLRSLHAFYYATQEMVSHNQEFKELTNCTMQWIGDKTAKVVLPSEENDFTNESFVSISGAIEESCNGLFEVTKANPKELMIKRLPDPALNNYLKSVEDSTAKSLLERMNQQKSLKELKTLWDNVISSESKSFPVGIKIKINDFYKHQTEYFAWETSFYDQQIKLLGKEKLKSRNLDLLAIYHEILEAFFEVKGVKGPDALRTFMDFVPSSFSTTAQEEILNSSKEEFIIQDYLKAENFEVDLPLKNAAGNQTHQRVPLLGLVEPQSPLFKFFARNPMNYPGSSDQIRFPMTYVNNPKNNGKTGEHIISVPHSEPYNLKGLSELLEEIEDRARKEKGEHPRPKDQPRDGIYKYNEPWYDERHSNCSIIDNPKDGSRLEISDVMEAIWHFGNPLERIEVEYATTSIFIPFWEDPGNNNGKSIFSERSKWSRFTYKNDFASKLSKNINKISETKKNIMSHAFLPFVEQIFDTTDQNPTAEGSLQAWRYEEKIKLNLNPKHIQNYGPAVSVIRKKEEQKVKTILEEAKVDLKVFSYEFGLGLINVDIQLPKGCSIMRTQWMEHLISITECKELLKGKEDIEVNPELKLPVFSDNGIEEGSIFLLMPDKHYACTTLSHFDLKGGSMTDCRSLGGGLQMVVNDAEPLFHNLPKEKRLKTKQTVVDEVTKRHFYCSSSSMLNYDDVAFEWEHVENHTFASMLFNMVLAQRYILAQVRKAIVESEWDYNQKKNDTNFKKWLKNKLKSIFLGKKDQQSPEEKISGIRDNIQHMTTSSWFNVVSSDGAIQEVFLKLRDQMNVNEFYTEVQERCKDLDEFIAKKQASVQSRVFDIFTFVMSPLSLVIGFMGGKYFTRLNEDVHPFPFFDLGIESGWVILLIYGFLFSILFLGVWILYKYKSFKA